MPKVSVIIPVYKVEDFLPACLESVANQTYQDFELILVDDGSPDTCGAMCDAYAADHPNTRVLHQVNMGLSEARNQGVKIAAGEYVTFIDSDDLVAPDYIEYLVYLAEKYDAEVSVAGRQKFWEDEGLSTMEQLNVADTLVSASEALNRICYGTMSITAWGKLYRRYLVERYPYPAGQLYEDTATTYKILGDVPSVAFGTKKIYYWRQRSKSITHDTINERHMFGIVGAKEQLEYMKQRYPEVVPAAQARCAMKIIDLAYRLVLVDPDKALFQRIRKEIKPLISPLLKNKRASISLKVRASVLYMGYVPYKILSKMYFIVRERIRDED